MIRLMVKRRSIIKGMASICGGLLVQSCEMPRQKQAPPHRVKLGILSNFSQTSVMLPLERLLLRRDERGYYAMSIVCTHQTCIIAASNQSTSEFICPCHGSRFSGAGKVLQGPASRDLPYYELERDGQGNLWVWIGKDVSPEWRLSHAVSG